MIVLMSSRKEYGIFGPLSEVYIRSTITVSQLLSSFGLVRLNFLSFLLIFRIRLSGKLTLAAKFC